MPKISDEKRQARRDQILAAALTCFERHGLHGATMEIIIAECGLSAGAVYNYYPSKAALIGAALGQALDGWAADLAPVFASDPPAPVSRLVAAAVEVAAAADEGRRRRRMLELLAWGETQRDEAVRARPVQGLGEALGQRRVMGAQARRNFSPRPRAKEARRRS